MFSLQRGFLPNGLKISWLGSMLGSMKVKISITLSEDLLKEIDTRIEPEQRTRSEFIEDAVRAYLAHTGWAALQAREATLLRKHAATLNAEMADVLEYQVIP